MTPLLNLKIKLLVTLGVPKPTYSQIYAQSGHHVNTTQIVFNQFRADPAKFSQLFRLFLEQPPAIA